MTSFLGRKYTYGFTLIELLVVISIIGILAAVLLVNFVGVRGRASDATKKNNLRQVKTALRLYYNDFQVYPAANGSQQIVGCGAGATACTDSFSANGTVFLSELPTDISYYADVSDRNVFLLQTSLENTSDADIAASVAKCDPTSRAYYGGTPTATDYFMCED